MKRKIIVLLILVCSFILFQQCSSLHTGKIKHTKPQISIKKSLIIVKQDSVLHNKGLVKKQKPSLVFEKDTIFIEGKQIVDSSLVKLYKDSLQVEKENNKLLHDSLELEKAKLLNAYLKSDTLILKTKQLFEAKILSLQKNNQPKVLYQLVPYKVVQKDIKSVIVTALSVFFVMLIIFFLLWRNLVKKPLSKIEVSETEKKILQDLKDEEFS